MNNENVGGLSVIHLPEIWDIILKHMPRRRSVSLHEIYKMVEGYGNLDDEDFEPQCPNSDTPKWKRNVRNVLQYRKRTREIEWDRHARYML